MKKNTTKKALLMSCLSLLLCCSMLVGTTFAWFTDTASTGRNKIIAGNLDVQLNDVDGNSIEGNEDIFVSPDGSVKGLWEPGHVEVAYLQVKNAGTLALTYELAMNILSETTAVNMAGDTFKLSEHLQLAVVDYTGKYASREEALAAATNATKFSALFTSGSEKLEPNQSKEIAMIVWMPETVGNEANYRGDVVPTIDFGINVFATQVSHENDSFGDDYDAKAAVVVNPGESIANAIANVEDGGIVFLENGVHILPSMLLIEGKNVTIIGLGNATIKTNAATQHIMTIQDSKNAESKMVVNLENLIIDGSTTNKNAINVKYNVTVNMKDVTATGAGWADVLLDNANKYTDGNFYNGTATRVNMTNCKIGSVSLDSLPVVDTHAYANAGVDTYAYLNYDATSTVGAIEVQGICAKPENIIINGIAADAIGETMQLYVSNDTELAEALNTIKTDSNYWNKEVLVYMTAGTYSADHVINQYPLWNGVSGHANPNNNYTAGVTAGDPSANVTFIGTNTNARAATSGVVFTGNVTVQGFGNSMTGFSTATAHTVFKNVVFDGANSVEENEKDYIALHVTAAANNVTFDGCTFQNATHVTLGGSTPNGVGTINITNCSFVNGNNLSGYFRALNVNGCTVSNAYKGFINAQSSGEVNVSNTAIDDAGEYVVRTKGSPITINVKDSTIDAVEELVFFRGNGEATFANCTLPANFTTKTVADGRTLAVYSDAIGATGEVLRTDGLTGEVTLYSVSAVTASEYTIPTGVTALRAGVFTYNSAIKTVTVPATVTDFGGTVQPNGEGASGSPFKNSAVEKIVLAEGITEITASAFEQAQNLKSINIPASVTTIGVEAFGGSGLTELVIPATVTNIEFGAFRDMPNLTTATIEGNVEVPRYAFRGCANLTTVTLLGTNVTFGNGQIFCNASNGAASKITIYVDNAEIEARLRAGNTSVINEYTVVCKNSAGANGIYTDTNGDTYAYANDTDALTSALTNDAATVYVSAGNYTFPSSKVGAGDTLVCDEGTVFTGNTKLNIGGATVEGATFSNDSGTAVDQTINGTFKDCTFTGYNALRWCYAGETVVFENCVFEGDLYGVHFDGGANNVTFKNCTFSGFNAMAAAINKLTLEGCIFKSNPNCGYNGINLWGDTDLIDCTFVFDGSAGTEWVDVKKSATFTGCVIDDGVSITPVTGVNDYISGTNIVFN